MALIEIEYTHDDTDRCLRSVTIPDDIFIRKLRIRRADGQVVWSVEFDYDWLREFMARHGRDFSEIQADSSGI